MALPYASLSPAVADHRSSPAAATASLLPFCRSTPLSAGGGGVAMGEDAPMTARWPAAAARLPPFTAAQYEELEQQALIYKYLVAGVPVPPDLVLPIRRGLDSLAARFYNHPAHEHSQLITEAINTSIENPWRLLPSQNSPFPLSSYSQLGALSDLGQNTPSSLSKVQRQPLSFFGNDYAAVDSVKQENQTLRPFFDEWPKGRDSWSDLADENANLSSFSGTQLSISIPMASSDFSAASSRSTNGD
uniref:Growth-regulating factor n=1 Tax=Oryza meridionalis TaxID=40149 RepID=A0A0E0CQ87_9ORYZ